MDNDKLLDKLIIGEIKTQSDYLADKIKNMIISGEFGDGYTFPNENDFCKRLNVSRSTLREAYKILDTQGFIHRTKHGTYVKDRQDIAEQGNFTASLELADRTEMGEFICALEPEAVYLAAKKIKEEDLKELEELMEACDAVADDSKKMLEENYQFHAYIRRLAGNHLITSALAAYYDVFNQQIVENIYYFNDDNEKLQNFRHNSLRQHRDLFDALKDKDAEKAREIAYQHLRDDLEMRSKQLTK